MSVRARGRSFQADFKLGDVRHRESFPTFEEAEAYEYECRLAYSLGKPIPGRSVSPRERTKVETISGLIDYVTETRWNRLKSRHAINAPRQARMFADWIGPKVSVAEALTDDRVRAYVQYRLHTTRNAESTINRHLAVIGCLARAALKLRLIDHAPEINKGVEGQGRMRVFTEDEQLLIVTTLRQWGYPDQADLMVWLADTGMRRGETERLLWRDIDLKHGTVTIPGEIAKNYTERTIGLTKAALEVLARMKERHGSAPGPFEWHKRKQSLTAHLWQRLRGHFPTWMDKECVLHTWRHTCASRLVRNGVSLYAVQRWLGHKSPLMTQRYAKFAPADMRGLAEVLDRRLAA